MGIHLRSAGLIGEPANVDRGDPMRMLLGSLHCARAWNKPIVLAASHYVIRRAVLDGAFKGVMGPVEDQAVHMSYGMQARAAAAAAAPRGPPLPTMPSPAQPRLLGCSCGGCGCDLR